MKKGYKNEDNKLQIHMVKTDKECYITDCLAIDGYDWNYHHSQLKELFFDGQKPGVTFSANWLKINKYPSKIKQLQHVPAINRRYELKNEELISDKLPKIIEYTDSVNYDDDIISSLYSYKEDKQKPIMVDVECEINIIMEIDNFELPPVINYKAIRRDQFTDKEFNITNQNIKHQLFDKVIFPEVMLHTRPCSISSQMLFMLVRQYIKDNINTKVAKITSDYDFCFTVKKIIPLLEPETISYSNIFAKTKKERSKIQYSTKTFKEVEIFEMTHAQSKYQNYTVIQPIYADNELELKNKIDEFLLNLITVINEPLHLCPNCKGTGYIDEIKRIKQEDIS